MSPSCPAHYYCTFTPQQKYTVVHTVGPWWHGGWGVVVAIVAVVAIAVVLGLLLRGLFEQVEKRREDKSLTEKEKRKQQHEIALEEQRTMQADAAKGDPEMLKLIRSSP